MLRGGRAPRGDKAGSGWRGDLEVGDRVGGSGRKRPSTQVGGEGDVGGVRAPKAAAPLRLGQRCPPCPCPWPLWQQRGCHWSSLPPGPQSGCWQAANTHARCMAGHCEASLVTSYLHQRIQLLIENREFFFNKTFLSYSLLRANHGTAREGCLPNT